MGTDPSLGPSCPLGWRASLKNLAQLVKPAAGSPSGQASAEDAEQLQLGRCPRMQRISHARSQAEGQARAWRQQH